MNTTSHRRALVPRSAIIAAIIIAVLVVSAGAAAWYVGRSRVVLVPNVTGIPQAQAEQNLTLAGLVSEVTGTQVSIDIPEGSVVSQSLAPGEEASQGTVVRLVISAGRQTHVVPDLVGLPLADARDQLMALGLTVSVETVSSTATETTVLEMYPSPGSTIATGEEVRLTVSGASLASTLLLPYDLAGISIVLDPGPPVSGVSGDPSMDVARRLQSLLQAAGATVAITRNATDTVGPPDARLAVAKASGASVFVGLDVASAGVGGISVLTSLQETDGDRAARSRSLAQAITRAARLPGQIVNQPSTTPDTVLAGFGGLGVRVVMADVNDASDRARLSDPAWADQVARAVYRGLGAQLESN